MTRAEIDWDGGIDATARVMADFPDFHLDFYVSMRMAPRQVMVFHGEEAVLTVRAPFNAYAYADQQIEIREADGRVVVSVLAGMFAFAPDPIEVPANVPITFRLTSQDVVHGFQVVGTNANAMAIPGYVSQFTITFAKPGEYTIACNEYCGLMHHAMVGKLVVK